MEDTSSVGARRLRTLVVDDFVSMQEAIASCVNMIPALELVGTALNGKEALDCVPNLKPDLVIVDLQMPIMDGFQLMRHLRRDHADIYLIAISGMASAAVEREAVAAGANAFVAKAAIFEGLVSRVEKLIQ